MSKWTIMHGLVGPTNVTGRFLGKECFLAKEWLVLISILKEKFWFPCGEETIDQSESRGLSIQWGI